MSEYIILKFLLHEKSALAGAHQMRSWHYMLTLIKYQAKAF